MTYNPAQYLDVFKNTNNWKSYWTIKISPLISGKVLEVGAGLGDTTRYFCQGREAPWLCLEPDIQLAPFINNKISAGELSRNVSFFSGAISDLPSDVLFDTILYIDVLEHIKNDKNELKLAANLLEKQGKLIVLSPAHSFLFSPFDRAVGHYRRYTCESLKKIGPSNCALDDCFYLDSLGLLASLGSVLTKKNMPSPWQVKLWDSYIIPVSKIIDPIIRYKIGKTVVATWRRVF